MSFDKEIGFDLQRADHLEILKRFGVEPRKYDLKDILPPGDKEPEPKLLLPRSKCFKDIRALILSSQNATIIPGRLYEDKNPLTSVLLDTMDETRFPTAELSRAGYSLRFRFETCPRTGMMTQRDYNEKSEMANAKIIGGCADRDERECEVPDDFSNAQGFELFKRKYRQDGKSPAKCDGFTLNDMSVLGGYLAARTEYGFAVRHPNHPVVFVFEACEDRFDTLVSNMTEATGEFHEFEFEAKAIYGTLPDFARNSREACKHFLYNSMTDVVNNIHDNIPDAILNRRSKAELARAHMEALYGIGHNQCGSLSSYFESRTPVGYNADFIPEQYALMLGVSLDDTLKYAGVDLFQRGARLHEEKRKNNLDSPKPTMAGVGMGNYIIGQNDNGRYARKLAYDS